MSAVAVYSHTQSVTYVTDNILRSLKDIIRLSGLNPENFVNSRTSYARAVNAWLASGHLEKVILEVFNPATNTLVGRWDIDVVYQWSGGDGSFWVDTDQIRFHIQKAGLMPSDAKYDVLLQHKPGAPAVDGWGPGTYRSTSGFVRQSLGATIQHGGLAAGAAYWRKA